MVNSNINNNKLAEISKKVSRLLRRDELRLLTEIVIENLRCSSVQEKIEAVHNQIAISVVKPIKSGSFSSE